MGADGPALTVAAVRERYATRRAQAQAAVDRLARRADRIAWARLATFLAAAGLGAASLRGRGGAGPAVAVLLVFGGLIAWSRLVAAATARAERRVAFHARGLSRLDGQWAGQGTRGAAFADPHHPYAVDLDLFGAGSLYELLCTCRTRIGETTLARWMLADVDAGEIRRRQEAVAALATDLDLREALWEAGDDVRSELDDEAVRRWATAPPATGGAAARALVAGLGLLGLGALVLWGTGAGAAPLVLVSVVQLPARWWLGRRTEHVLHAADGPARALALGATMLARFRAAAPDAPLLRELAAAVDETLVPAVGRLRRLVDLSDAQHNPFFAPIGFVLLWPMQLAFAIERWRATHGGEVARWLAQLGTLEALVAGATYAAEHPDEARPEMVGDGAVFEATALGHPLLERAACVRNDVALGEGTRVLLVSGSNMSGKSTLLRAVGAAIVLARLGAPVRARRCRMAPLALGASIRTVDSLREGTSRFYAEITRLRQIVDLAAGDRPTLFLLDEVLHGTNSHDRRIGAAAVVRGLVGRGAIGLVTTHDLAVTAIADEPGAGVRNVHFADRLEDGRMVFDYRMREGVVTHSNALALMRAVGLEV